MKDFLSSLTRGALRLRGRRPINDDLTAASLGWLAYLEREGPSEWCGSELQSSTYHFRVDFPVEWREAYRHWDRNFN